MWSGRIEKILLGLWIVSLASITYLLINEDRFFAISGAPVANVIRSNHDVTYRSESDTRWKSIGGVLQGVFDGDKVATGPNSQATIDFGDGRAANIGEETSITLSTIRQSTGMTYIISMAKGSVAIEKLATATSRKDKAKFPIIVRSGGRDFFIEPEEEKGIVKDDLGTVEFKGKRERKVKLPPKEEVPLIALQPTVLEAIPVVELVPSIPAPATAVPIPTPPIPAPEAPKPLAQIKKPPSKPAVAIATPAPIAAPAPVAAGTEIKLDTSGMKSSYFTFQSLSAATGDLGVVKWLEPTSPPAGWSPVLELTNGGKIKIIDDLKGPERYLKIEDIGPLLSDVNFEGLPCATLGIRGGGKIVSGGIPNVSFAGKPAQLRICSYRDAAINSPLVVGMSSIGSQNYNRGKLFSAPQATDLKYQITVTSPVDYLSILPLMEQSKNLRVVRAQGLSPSGVYIAKSGKVVMQLSGPGFNAVAADKILGLSGGDFVFKGQRSALYDATSLTVDQLKAWVSKNSKQGKKVYVQKSGTLLSVSSDFLEERREVAAFIKSVAAQILTEKVEIVAFK